MSVSLLTAARQMEVSPTLPWVRLTATKRDGSSHPTGEERSWHHAASGRTRLDRTECGSPGGPPSPTLQLLGGIEGSGLRGFSRLKHRLDELSGVGNWCWHRLSRRTARTGMTRLGVPRDHAEAALNHISGRSTMQQTYDQHDFAPEVIAASSRWQAHVEGLVAPSSRAVIRPRFAAGDESGKPQEPKIGLNSRTDAPLRRGHAGYWICLTSIAWKPGCTCSR